MLLYLVITIKYYLNKNVPLKNWNQVYAFAVFKNNRWESCRHLLNSYNSHISALIAEPKLKQILKSPFMSKFMSK